MVSLLPVAPDFGLTPELVAFVKTQEGWRAAPYLDQVGLPTIGYGHRIPTLALRAITLAQGEDLLRADLRIARDAAVRISPVLAQFERRCSAITDFCFNAGPLRYATSRLRAAVDAQAWAAAGAQMRKWVYGHKNGQLIQIPALVGRRAVTSKWLEEG